MVIIVSQTSNFQVIYCLMAILIWKQVNLHYRTESRHEKNLTRKIALQLFYCY